MEKEKLNLDSKLLSPIKLSLENVINRLMYEVLNKNKEAEVNLKIQINKEQKEKLYKEINLIDKWIEPRFAYTITEKVKEHKETNKGIVGFNFIIDQDEDCFLVEEVNKQESLFEKENIEEAEEE